MSVAMRLVESRVDWITGTMMLHKATTPDPIECSLQLADELITNERRKGNQLRRWSFSGFDGLTSGQVSVGQSGQGMIYRLSGDAARDNWQKVHAVATNISRLDVAATYELQKEWRDMSYVHWLEAMDYQRKHNPRMRVTRIDGGKFGRTLTIGSRSSDAYGRIYDKHAESKREEYRDCWRYEVEFKRSQAVQAAQLLADSPGRPAQAAEVASGWFRTRGCSHIEVPTDQTLPCSSQQPSEDARRLRWLRMGVRGSVQRLIETGHKDEVLQALGIRV